MDNNYKGTFSLYRLCALGISVKIFWNTFCEMKSYLKHFAKQKFLNEIKNLKAFQSYCKINSHKMYHEKIFRNLSRWQWWPLVLRERWSEYISWSNFIWPGFYRRWFLYFLKSVSILQFYRHSKSWFFSVYKKYEWFQTFNESFPQYAKMPVTVWSVRWCQKVIYKTSS